MLSYSLFESGYQFFNTIPNWDESIFFTIGVSYIVFSTAVLIHWIYNVYKSFVAKALAQELLASSNLLNGYMRKNKAAIIKRLEKLATHPGAPKDFAVALAALHMLRHEINVAPSTLLDEMRKMNRTKILQMKKDCSNIISRNELRKYSPIKPQNEQKIGFLVERLQQNLLEIINYDEYHRAVDEHNRAA